MHKPRLAMSFDARFRLQMSEEKAPDKPKERAAASEPSGDSSRHLDERVDSWAMLGWAVVRHAGSPASEEAESLVELQIPTVLER